MSNDDLIEEIRAHHHDARFAIKSQQRSDRSLEAFIVDKYIGLPRDADKQARLKAWKAAKSVIAEAMVNVSQNPGGSADAIAPIVLANELSRKPWDSLRATHEKAMTKLAQKLPVWNAWGKGIRGFGAKSLAQIVAEAGDLANYSTEAKLWKRFGLAVMDGSRQGNPGKNASAQLWSAHGYNPQRRSIMWNVGQSIFKAQSIRIDKDSGEIKRDAGPYRLIYDRRKTYELARGLSKLHAHNRATRYMEKAFIADLWSAWRRAGHIVSASAAILRVPAAATITEAAAL